MYSYAFDVYIIIFLNCTLETSWKVSRQTFGFLLAHKLGQGCSMMALCWLRQYHILVYFVSPQSTPNVMSDCEQYSLIITPTSIFRPNVLSRNTNVLVRRPGNVAVTCPAFPSANINGGCPVDLNAPWRTFPQTCQIWESHSRWYELLEYSLLDFGSSLYLWA